MIAIYTGFAVQPLLEKENKSRLLDDWRLRWKLGDSEVSCIGTVITAIQDITHHLGVAASRWLTTDSLKLYKSHDLINSVSFVAACSVDRPDSCIIGRCVIVDGSFEPVLAFREIICSKLESLGLYRSAMFIEKGYAYACTYAKHAYFQPLLHFERESRNIYRSKPRCLEL